MKNSEISTVLHDAFESIIVATSADSLAEETRKQIREQLQEVFMKCIWLQLPPSMRNSKINLESIEVFAAKNPKFAVNLRKAIEGCRSAILESISGKVAEMVKMGLT